LDTWGSGPPPGGRVWPPRWRSGEQCVDVLFIGDRAEDEQLRGGRVLAAGPQRELSDGGEVSEGHLADRAVRGRGRLPGDGNLVAAAGVAAEAVAGWFGVEGPGEREETRWLAREGPQAGREPGVTTGEHVVSRQLPDGPERVEHAGTVNHVRPVKLGLGRIRTAARGLRERVMADDLRGAGIAGEDHEKAVGRGAAGVVASVELQEAAHGTVAAFAVRPALVAVEVGRAVHVRAAAAVTERGGLFEGRGDPLEEGGGHEQRAERGEKGVFAGQRRGRDVRGVGGEESWEVVERGEEGAHWERNVLGHSKAHEHGLDRRDGVAVDAEGHQQFAGFAFDGVRTLVGEVLEDQDEPVDALAAGVQGGEAGEWIDRRAVRDDEHGAGAGVVAVDVALEVNLVPLDENGVIVVRRSAVGDAHGAERQAGKFVDARDVHCEQGPERCHGIAPHPPPNRGRAPGDMADPARDERASELHQCATSRSEEKRGADMTPRATRWPTVGRRPGGLGTARAGARHVQDNPFE